MSKPTDRNYRNEGRFRDGLPDELREKKKGQPQVVKNRADYRKDWKNSGERIVERAKVASFDWEAFYNARPKK